MSTRSSAPADILSASRVDLIGRIRDGIPEPAYVPGGEGWLLAGKRYLVPAPAGAGKSLVALVIAVTVVEHGGTVVILDVENGADEYARRLEDILGARDFDGTLAEACSQRLHYHYWPRFSLEWPQDTWGEAIGGADLVIFDSSRLVLSSVGLEENSNDDYAKFMTALVVPLSLAGTTTMILDNVGHDGTHSRGASTKRDLNEVEYALSVGTRFDRDRAGFARLTRKRERFGGLPRVLRIDLGGDTYTAPTVIAGEDAADDFRPTVLMERVSGFVEGAPGCTLREIRAGVQGKNDYIDAALRILIAEGNIERIQDGRAGRHSCAPDVPYLPLCAPGHGQPYVPRAPLSKEGARGHVDGTPAADVHNMPSSDAAVRAEALLTRHGDLEPFTDDEEEKAGEIVVRRQATAADWEKLDKGTLRRLPVDVIAAIAGTNGGERRDD
jgi:hypothetical protein